MTTRAGRALAAQEGLRMQYFCGVDTGGTFTDCVVMNEQEHLTKGYQVSFPQIKKETSSLSRLCLP